MKPKPRGPTLGNLGGIVKATIPHLLALAIALLAGWLIYQHGQEEKLNQSLVALMFDSGRNMATLRGVIEGENWRKDTIDTRFADPTVARALISDASIFAAGLDRSLMLAVVVYAQQMEAIHVVMQFMEERFVRQGHLTEVNLETLDHACRQGIAAIKVLQRHLAPAMSERALLVGASAAKPGIDELQREYDEVLSHVFSEGGERNAGGE